MWYLKYLLEMKDKVVIIIYKCIVYGETINNTNNRWQASVGERGIDACENEISFICFIYEGTTSIKFVVNGQGHMDN